MQNFNMTEYLKYAVELEKTVYVQEHTIQQLDSKINSLCVRRGIGIPKKRELGSRRGTSALYLGNAFVGIGIGVLLLLVGNGCLLVQIASSLPFLFGIIMLIAGLSVLLKARKDKQRLLDEYESKMIDAARMKQLEDERIEREKTIQENLSVQRMELYDKYTESKSVLGRLYDLDIIFPKYRNLVAICSFYEYFVTGRCSVLEGHEGAYNIYENEIRLNAIIARLDDVIAHLEQIEQNQYMLYSAIVEGNQKIDKLVTLSEEIASKLDYISEQSAITAQNSAWAAQEANTIKWLEIIRS